MPKLFYFPGSENASRISRKLAQKIPDCELKSIRDISTCILVEDDIVGVVLPVNYLGLPEAFETFLKNIQTSPETYLFVVVTRGLWAGGVKTQLLKKLKSRVSYFQYIALGDSFNIDFWKYSSEKDRALQDRQCDAFVDQVVGCIQKRRITRPFSFEDLMPFSKGKFHKSKAGDAGFAFIPDVLGYP